MDERDDGRKREAEARAFVRLVGQLDRQSVHLLLRLAQAIQRGDGEDACREAEGRLQARAAGDRPEDDAPPPSPSEP
jgi:hypothetical protein